jgi:hypothetical protein
MIRPLRARHRAIFVALAVLVPATYAAALLGRRAPAPESDWPAAEPATTDGAAQTLQHDRWSPHALETELLRDGGGATWLRVDAWREPLPPAAVLYWSPIEPRDGELPPQARFLGALQAAPCRFALPHGSARGWLVLYSLGHGSVSDALALEGAH